MKVFVVNKTFLEIHRKTASPKQLKYWTWGLILSQKKNKWLHTACQIKSSEALRSQIDWKRCYLHPRHGLELVQMGSMLMLFAL